MTSQTNEQRIFKWWNKNCANKRREKKSWNVLLAEWSLDAYCTHFDSLFFTLHFSYLHISRFFCQQISEKREYKQNVMQNVMQSPLVREIDKQSIENCRFVIQNTGKSKTHSTHSWMRVQNWIKIRLRSAIFSILFRVYYRTGCAIICMQMHTWRSRIFFIFRFVYYFVNFFCRFHGILFREIICCWSWYGWCLYLSSGCLAVQNAQRAVVKVHISVPCLLFCVDCFSNNIHTRWVAKERKKYRCSSLRRRPKWFLPHECIKISSEMRTHMLRMKWFFSVIVDSKFIQSELKQWKS